MIKKSKGCTFFIYFLIFSHITSLAYAQQEKLEYETQEVIPALAKHALGATYADPKQAQAALATVDPEVGKFGATMSAKQVFTTTAHVLSISEGVLSALGPEKAVENVVGPVPTNPDQLYKFLGEMPRSALEGNGNGWMVKPPEIQSSGSSGSNPSSVNLGVGRMDVTPIPGELSSSDMMQARHEVIQGALEAVKEAVKNVVTTAVEAKVAQSVPAAAEKKPEEKPQTEEKAKETAKEPTETKVAEEKPTTEKATEQEKAKEPETKTVEGKAPQEKPVESGEKTKGVDQTAPTTGTPQKTIEPIVGQIGRDTVNPQEPVGTAPATPIVEGTPEKAIIETVRNPIGSDTVNSKEPAVGIAPTTPIVEGTPEKEIIETVKNPIGSDTVNSKEPAGTTPATPIAGGTPAKTIESVGPIGRDAVSPQETVGTAPATPIVEGTPEKAIIETVRNPIGSDTVVNPQEPVGTAPATPMVEGAPEKKIIETVKNPIGSDTVNPKEPVGTAPVTSIAGGTSEKAIEPGVSQIGNDKVSPEVGIGPGGISDGGLTEPGITGGTTPDGTAPTVPVVGEGEEKSIGSGTETIGHDTVKIGGGSGVEGGGGIGRETGPGIIGGGDKGVNLVDVGGGTKISDEGVGIGSGPSGSDKVNYPSDPLITPAAEPPIGEGITPTDTGIGPIEGPGGPGPDGHPVDLAETPGPIIGGESGPIVTDGGPIGSDTAGTGPEISERGDIKEVNYPSDRPDEMTNGLGPDGHPVDLAETPGPIGGESNGGGIISGGEKKINEPSGPVITEGGPSGPDVIGIGEGPGISADGGDINKVLYASDPWSPVDVTKDPSVIGDDQVSPGPDTTLPVVDTGGDAISMLTDGGDIIGGREEKIGEPGGGGKPIDSLRSGPIGSDWVTPSKPEHPVDPVQDAEDAKIELEETIVAATEVAGPEPVKKTVDRTIEEISESPEFVELDPGILGPIEEKIIETTDRVVDKVVEEIRNTDAQTDNAENGGVDQGTTSSAPPDTSKKESTSTTTSELPSDLKNNKDTSQPTDSDPGKTIKAGTVSPS